jgi:hypothetical protein
MFGLIEDRGIDENEGGTRHPTRRRVAKTAAAIRQRRLRDRRHRGFVCVTVEIGADDIGGLIDRGLLHRLHQDDPDQVQGALHAFLDQTLAGVVSHG